MWIFKSVNLDGLTYWDYVLIHTYDNDIILISHENTSIIEGVAKLYNPKKDPRTKNNYYDPKRHLETNVGNFYHPYDSVAIWVMSGENSVK